MTEQPTDDERIRHALATISTSWPDMLTIMPRRNLGPMVSTIPGSKPPANIVVLSTRRYVCERLASWCRLVMDDATDANPARRCEHGEATITLSGDPTMDACPAGLPWANKRDPAHPDEWVPMPGFHGIYGNDASGMCAFLIRWADFLAAHEAGSDAVQEMEADARSCEAIALDLRKRRFEVGRCIGHTETDLGERVSCAGTLSAILSNDQALLPLLHCDTDPLHVWDGSQWGEISRMPVTVEDASRITRIPIRSIYRWLTDGDVLAVAESRPVLVRLSEVTRRAAAHSA